MKNKLVAVVPVRERSTRIKNKNFKDFINGKSLLENKILQLKKSNFIDRIFISSDSNNAWEIAEKTGVEFLKRDSKFCIDGPRNNEIIDHIISTVPDSPYIAYVLATNPFFQKFDEAITTFFKNEKSFDSLVTVNKRKEYFLNKSGRPINYTFGAWHDFSQNIDPLYLVTGGMFLAHKTTMQYLHYYIGVSPLLFETNLIESIDIDEEDQFVFSQQIAQHMGA